MTSTFFRLMLTQEAVGVCDVCTHSIMLISQAKYAVDYEQT